MCNQMPCNQSEALSIPSKEVNISENSFNDSLCFYLIREEKRRMVLSACWLRPPYHASGLPGAAVRCAEIQLLQVPTGFWQCHATTQALRWSLCASTCRHTSKTLTWIDTTSSTNAEKLITDSREKKKRQKNPQIPMRTNNTIHFHSSIWATFMVCSR